MDNKYVVKALPSSFVASCMKLATDRGAGEAKMWVGQKSNEAELDEFFAFDENYTYTFSKDNLLDYLKQVKVEYVYQKFNNYKNASIETWNSNFGQIDALTDNEFLIHLTKFTDDTRYYVRAEEDIFKKVFRKISIPKLTNVVFIKDVNNKIITLTLELNLDYDSVTADEADLSADVLSHNLYGIHIKELNDALSEDHPHICIGWSKLGDLTGVTSKEELSAKYDFVWPGTKSKSKGQNVGQIWRFCNDVQMGDYVIFADGDYCHIGRVESDYYYDSTKYQTQSEDYTNVRKVMWLKTNIQRSELSEALHRSLRTSMSIWAMNDYRASVVDLLNDTYVKDEVDEEPADVIDAKEQKEKFRSWMLTQKKDNGEPYSINTINTYIGQMERGYAQFDKYSNCETVFDIQDSIALEKYMEYLFNTPSFNEFNEKAGNMACSCGLIKYNEFLKQIDMTSFELVYNTGYKSEFSRNRIVFGAPGTGKSFKVNEDRASLLGENKDADYERVTFHPDYSYANFVGTYKPVSCKDEDGKDTITYEYVPGPFMRVYVDALKNGRTDNVKPYLLIIEEINRANVAAVFGDVFQLLDRDDDGVSAYPIQTSEDIKKYLAKKLGGDTDNYNQIKIPDNMFIWATMNSADQGVFPMDTAFKRRWDFTYIGIDDNDKDTRGKYVVVGSKEKQRIEWNELRKAINDFLAEEKINEDKQLGPYFIPRSIVVPAGDEIDSDKFCDVFKHKVLMYLFDDAAKQKRQKLFKGSAKGQNRYSKLCEAFDEQGIGIFHENIQSSIKIEDIVINGQPLEESE